MFSSQFFSLVLLLIPICNGLQFKKHDTLVVTSKDVEVPSDFISTIHDFADTETLLSTLNVNTILYTTTRSALQRRFKDFRILYEMLNIQDNKFLFKYGTGALSSSADEITELVTIDASTFVPNKCYDTMHFSNTKDGFHFPNRKLNLLWNATTEEVVDGTNAFTTYLCEIGDRMPLIGIHLRPSGESAIVIEVNRFTGTSNVFEVTQTHDESVATVSKSFTPLESGRLYFIGPLEAKSVYCHGLNTLVVFNKHYGKARVLDLSQPGAEWKDLSTIPIESTERLVDVQCDSSMNLLIASTIVYSTRFVDTVTTYYVMSDPLAQGSTWTYLAKVNSKSSRPVMTVSRE